MPPAQWDHDDSGYITKAQCLDKQRGLLQFVHAHLLKAPSPPVAARQLSDNCQRSPEAWFAFFDEGGSGSQAKLFDKVTSLDLFRNIHNKF